MGQGPARAGQRLASLGGTRTTRPKRASSAQLAGCHAHGFAWAWARRRLCIFGSACRFSRTGQRGGLSHARSEEHTSELQSLRHLVCRLLLEKKKITHNKKVR